LERAVQYLKQEYSKLVLPKLATIGFSPLHLQSTCIDINDSVLAYRVEYEVIDKKYHTT